VPVPRRPPGVHDRPLEAGFITGYRAAVNAADLGYGMQVLVGVQLSHAGVLDDAIASLIAPQMPQTAQDSAAWAAKVSRRGRTSRPGGREMNREHRSRRAI